MKPVIVTYIHINGHSQNVSVCLCGMYKRVSIQIYLENSDSSRRAKTIARQMQEPIIMPESLLPAGLNQTTIRLYQYVVGVMHTLVLNLGKHLLLTIVDLLDGYDWSLFYNQCDKSLKEIKSLSLSWCKAYHIGSIDKPGSVWVSENYLAFAMICKSLFCRMRNDSGEYTNILRTIWCYNSMLSYIMKPCTTSDETCHIVSSLSKLFLSYFNSLNNQITRKNLVRKGTSRTKGKKKDISMIESASCIINVLKVSQEMLRKGMQQNNWEEGLNGEGSIRIVKPLVKKGISQTGIFYSTTKQIYCLREINNLIDNEDMLEEDKMMVSQFKDKCNEYHSSTHFSQEQLLSNNHAVDPLDPYIYPKSVDSKTICSAS